MEHFSTEEINENMSNAEEDMKKESSTTKTDDACDEKPQPSSTNANLSTANDNEPWAIEEDSDSSIEHDKKIIQSSEPFNMNESERKVLTRNRKLQNPSYMDLKPLSRDDKTEEDHSPSAKKIKPFQFDECSSKKNVEKDATLLNSPNLSSPSCSTDLYGPSCSTSSYCPPRLSDLLHQSNPIDSSDFSNKPTKRSNLVNPKKTEVSGLLNFYNKTFANESSPSTATVENETHQEAKVSHLDECNLVKDSSKNAELDNNDENSQSDGSESFVEDPDVVNPDIMYNINLNEHYKQMDLLVEKITLTPDDPTFLDECRQLPPIPQMEPGQNTITAEERRNFAAGISEWEYEIDRDDWNKIMVKRAVVFTAHSGFSIANEESLYVLADVAIDYIKKLAAVMKKNFDIHSRCSRADNIDPIHSSLVEIGVKGGIREIIKHFENDVFGRRNTLMKKCQHLQKIIDQYVERMLSDPKLKNQYAKDNFEENLTNEKDAKKDENVLSTEIKTEADVTTEVVQSDIQLMTEEVKMETTEETAYANIEVEQTEPVYIDTADIEVKMDIDSPVVEHIKIDALDINDRKINYKRVVDTKVKDAKIDLLKPLVIEPDFKFQPGTSKTKEGSLSATYLDCQNKKLSGVKNSKKTSDGKPLRWEIFPGGISEHKRDESNKKIKQAKEFTKSVIKEFDDEFELFKANRLTGSNIASNSSTSTQPDANLTCDDVKPVSKAFTPEDPNKDNLG